MATTTSGRRRWAWSPAVAIVLALATACDAEAPSDDELAERDARAVAHATGPLDGAPRLVYLAGQFAVAPGLDPADPDAFLRDAVAAVHARLALVFEAIDCDASVDTDGQSRVSMALSGCTLLLWQLDTELEAVARVQTEDCETGTCATGVRWDLDIAEMSTGLRGRPPIRFSGLAELYAPADPGARMQWQTQPGFTIETPLGLRFETLSNASFRIGDDDCVEVDIGARLSLEDRDGERPDALDERIGNVVLSGRNLRRCPRACPERGRVELSFGAGQVLAWEHDGSATILVEGPRGRRLEAELPCEAASGAGG
jgi:hypothetical protein